MLPVVLNHAGVPGVHGGFIGVDIFFVISGFLITGILAREIEERRFSIVRFYERRARRILPALFAVLAACLIGGWFLLSPERYEALGKSTLATLLFSSNLWFWHGAGDYFGTGVEFEPLLHTWSLAVEEQFYLGFPLILWLIAGRSRRVWIAVVGLLAALSLLLAVWMTAAYPTASFYLVPSRIWELGAGALLALGALPAARSRVMRDVAGWAGLALIVAGLVLIDKSVPFPGLAALPPVLGAVLLIHAGTQPGATVSRLLSARPLVAIGLISYSLYLWHWPIIVAARVMADDAPLTLAAAALCVALAVALAWASWRFIERPFRHRAQGPSLSAPLIFAVSLAGALVLGAGGVLVQQNRGLLGQYPPEQEAAYLRATARSALDAECTDRSEGASPCRIGAAVAEAGPVRVVVWGDSHAGAMLDGFEQWLQTEGEVALAFTKSACAPIPGLWRVDRPREHRCDVFNDHVLSQIEANPDIREVILVGRWALTTEGTRAPHESGAQAILAASGEISESVSENAALVAEGMDDLVARLRARGIEVVIAAGVPEIGRSVPDLVLSYGEDLPASGLLPDRADYEARNARANRILEEVAARHGARLVNPAEVMCPDRCMVQLNGDPLYRDDDHLSEFGARWLVPQLLSGIPAGEAGVEEPGEASL